MSGLGTREEIALPCVEVDDGLDVRGGRQRVKDACDGDALCRALKAESTATESTARLENASPDRDREEVCKSKRRNGPLGFLLELNPDLAFGEPYVHEVADIDLGRAVLGRIRTASRRHKKADEVCVVDVRQRRSHYMRLLNHGLFIAEDPGDLRASFRPAMEWTKTRTCDIRNVSCNFIVKTSGSVFRSARRGRILSPV